MKKTSIILILFLFVSCANRQKLTHKTDKLEAQQESHEIVDVIAHITELADLQIDFKVEEKKDSTGTTTKTTTGSIHKKQKKETEQTVQQTVETKSVETQHTDIGTSDIKEKPIAWGWLSMAIIAICGCIIFILIKKRN